MNEAQNRAIPLPTGLHPNGIAIFLRALCALRVERFILPLK